MGHIDQSQTPQDESNRNNVNNAFWDLHSFDWIDQNNHEEDNTEAGNFFSLLRESESLNTFAILFERFQFWAKVFNNSTSKESKEKET